MSTFTSQEKDLVNGIADIDLHDHSDEPQRKNLKYMHQLVRGCSVELSSSDLCCSNG